MHRSAGPVSEALARLQTTGAPATPNAAALAGRRLKELEEITMFRKLSLVAVAVPSPSAAALAGADVGFRLGLDGGWHRGPASRRRRPRLR